VHVDVTAGALAQVGRHLVEHEVRVTALARRVRVPAIQRVAAVVGMVELQVRPHRGPGFGGVTRETCQTLRQFPMWVAYGFLGYERLGFQKRWLQTQQEPPQGQDESA
jgi:hypothetical protein